MHGDQDVQVQVRFTVHDDDLGDFADALYFPVDEWPVPDAQLEAAKWERFDAWKAAVTAPAPDPEPVPEPSLDDRMQQAVGLAAQATELAAAAQAIADSFTTETPVDDGG
jgi:hypothetical protein